MPSSSPTVQPTAECVEDPTAKIVGQLDSTQDFFATCGQLAANPQYITQVCSLDPYAIALSLSPSVQCPQTCGDPSASEDPNAPVLGLVSGTTVQRGTCGQLAQSQPNFISVACSLDISLWNSFDAAQMCCDTCSGV